VAGWQIAGVTTIQSGSTINVTISPDRANIGPGFQRPNLIGPVPRLNCDENPGNRDLVNCFDATAFEMPAQFTFGNAPRNVLRGPKFVSTDLSMAKNVPVGGDVRLQVRMEFFNAFNNVNPGSTFGAATFGRISSAGDMRRIQLGARLIF
jgi:hypothetical protein